MPEPPPTPVQTRDLASHPQDPATLLPTPDTHHPTPDTHHPTPITENPIYRNHVRWMQRAIELAAQAGAAGEVSVGAVIVAGDQLIAEGENRRERDRDPTAHAEIVALRSAGATLQTWRLENCTMYVTLEPCPMCAGAIVAARLGTLVYGADDPKTGSIRTVANIPDSACSNHRPIVWAGILEADCRIQLQQWFSQRRCGDAISH